MRKNCAGDTTKPSLNTYLQALLRAEKRAPYEYVWNISGRLQHGPRRGGRRRTCCFHSLPDTWNDEGEDIKDVCSRTGGDEGHNKSPCYFHRTQLNAGNASTYCSEKSRYIRRKVPYSFLRLWSPPSLESGPQSHRGLPHSRRNSPRRLSRDIQYLNKYSESTGPYSYDMSQRLELEQTTR